MGNSERERLHRVGRLGFTTNLQWSGVTSPSVLRPWSKRNQENYLMRSCRGREWGHGVRRLGGRGAGSPGGQSRGRRSMERKEQGQGGRRPGSWKLAREQRVVMELDRVREHQRPEAS